MRDTTAMTTTTLEMMTLICALGSGLIAGFFFAFSILVMRALGTRPAPHGIAAMQSINVVVINPWFLIAFFGTALACLLAIAAALLRWDDPRALYWIVGSNLFNGDFSSSEGAFTVGIGVRGLIGKRVIVGAEARVGWELHIRLDGIIGVQFGR
jgi:uncharacterized membrane protein